METVLPSPHTPPILDMVAPPSVPIKTGWLEHIFTPSFLSSYTIQEESKK